MIIFRIFWYMILVVFLMMYLIFMTGSVFMQVLMLKGLSYAIISVFVTMLPILALGLIGSGIRKMFSHKEKDLIPENERK